MNSKLITHLINLDYVSFSPSAGILEPYILCVCVVHTVLPYTVCTMYIFALSVEKKMKNETSTLLCKLKKMKCNSVQIKANEYLIPPPTN